MKKSIGVMLFLGVFFLMLTSASATTFTFSDNTIYWPTWQSNSSKDAQDFLGFPDIKQVVVLTNDPTQKLTTIKIVFDTRFDDPQVAGGSGLFIDVNGDSKWDYFANNFNVPAYADLPTTSLDLGLYKLKAEVSLEKGGLNADKYKKAVAIGSNVRDGHPIGISKVLWDTKTDLGYSYDDNLRILTYTFPAVADIVLSDSGKWIIGYTVMCGNDVFLSSAPETPVPEPATLLLIGIGLIGLAGFGKGMFFRK